MRYFNFDRLIDKYSTEYTAFVPSKKTLSRGGEWVEGEPIKKTFQGAIIGMTESKVFRSDGTYTKQDKILLQKKPLDKALIGTTIIHGNKKYSVLSDDSNAEFTGVYSYILKYVSVFKEEGE